ncbi:MAG: hypothetical protein AB7U25_09000 [Vicinamibacterales bacterium]
MRLDHIHSPAAGVWSKNDRLQDIPPSRRRRYGGPAEAFGRRRVSVLYKMLWDDLTHGSHI